MNIPLTGEDLVGNGKQGLVFLRRARARQNA
jgi:hypothetical protein